MSLRVVISHCPICMHAQCAELRKHNIPVVKHIFLALLWPVIQRFVSKRFIAACLENLCWLAICGK